MNIINRIQYIINDEVKAINSIKVTKDYEDVINIMKSCRGKVLTTGMGKAGIIAKKFASTLCSTATPSVYIHPAESAHGDLGIIDYKDCLIAFSTSGKTEEVIELIRFARHLNIEKVVGITSHIDSELRNICDVIIDMGIIEEAGYLGLAPTSSTAVMLVISDALAMTLMEIKEVDIREFGLRHHGGYLGKKSRLNNDI